MKNITVTVEDDIYRQARIYAAWRSTSVSALVQQFLASLEDLASDILNEPMKAPPLPRKRRQKL